jgi:predicted RNA-binding Zn-ribbon protein involved in translation (DUF1610 family)
MAEPGKANLWASWVRWVSLGFTVCILLGVALPIGAALLFQVLAAAAPLGISYAWLTRVLPVLAIALLLVGIAGGIIWSSFIAPPLMAGGMRHLRWRDRPDKLRKKLMFSPMSPAVGVAAITGVVPTIVLGYSILASDPFIRKDFPFVGFFAWMLPTLILLYVIGLPIRRVTRRRFDRTLADARVCVTCGYDLRGLTSPACPECGEPDPAYRSGRACLGCGYDLRMNTTDRCPECGEPDRQSVAGREAGVAEGG